MIQTKPLAQESKPTVFAKLDYSVNGETFDVTIRTEETNTNKILAALKKKIKKQASEYVLVDFTIQY